MSGEKQLSIAKQFHTMAEVARENGEFGEALIFTDRAMLAYEKEKNMAGFAEILASRLLTLRHLAEKTGNDVYLVVAKYTVLASVELAERSGDKGAAVLPYYNLGKLHESLKEFEEAEKAFEKAHNMSDDLPKQHNRAGVKADIAMHLATIKYGNGDKSSLTEAEKQLKLIEENEPGYTGHVWAAIGHMRIADMMQGDDLQKADEHLQAAKKVIDGDERLVLVKAKWEKLAAKFS